ncbi:MAG: hypothetical protein LBP88_04410 [Treponema sp.]|jgi:hypothetical protein|nr:hypothetical protein [Treponema sp.]
MKIMRWLALSWLVVLIPETYSQTLEPGGVITGLEISGLKRTKPQVAERPLKQFIGQDADRLDRDAVHAALMDTGILEPLKVEIQDAQDGNGKILMVEVREKWSIFPLPVIFVGSGSTRFGGFFIDTNAFGLSDNFFIGGMYGSDSWMTGLGYSHTPVPEGFPGWRLFAMFAQAELHHTDQRNQDLRRFNLDNLSTSAGLTYPFTDHLKGSLGISYEQRMLRETGNPLAAPESGERVIGISAEVSLRKSRWDGFLLSEESLYGGYTFKAGLEGPSFQVLHFQGIYKKSLVPGFRVNLHTGALYEPGVTLLSESSPAAVQVAILPSSFSARHYGGASLGLEKYLVKISAGVLSGVVSYQAVYSQGSILGDQFDHGIAGALSFYLSKLAIPALEIGIAYNVPADYLQGSFSLGMSL